MRGIVLFAGKVGVKAVLIGLLPPLNEVFAWNSVLPANLFCREFPLFNHCVNLADAYAEKLRHFYREKVIALRQFCHFDKALSAGQPLWNRVCNVLRLISRQTTIIF